MTAGRILVTGATGRLGRAVLATLGERGIAGVRRREAARDAVLIASDGKIDPAALGGIAAIINCAGRVDGTDHEIEEANVVYPAALARAARSAGVARFVQVSSFSVFGRIDHIMADSAIAPADAYGRSKVAAEQALGSLDRDGFATIRVRLPFMFSAEDPAHLGRLVSVMRRLRALPTPAGNPSRRSMLTYSGAAEVLASLAGTAEAPGGTVAAADPEPLALVTIARAVTARLGRRIAILPVPRPVIAAAALAAPGLANRLFRSSVLDSEANLLTGCGMHSVEREMYAYLDRLAAGLSAGQDDVN